MIYPLLPLFLFSVLGSPALALGLIEGTAQVIVSIMSAYSGTISDRTGKRVNFIRWGYGLPILGKTLICLAGSWQHVLLGRSLDRFGKGLRGSPRDALIADAIDSVRRGQAFGYHRMMDTAGAFVGVIIAAAALWLLQGSNIEFIYRVVFGLAALLALCSLVVSFFVQESDAVTIKQAPVKTTLAQDLYTGLGRDYWITLLILSVFAFANSSDTFLMLRAADVGLSVLQVVLVYAVYNLSYSLFSYSCGKLSDKFGRWRVISLGWGIYSLVYLGIATSDNIMIWGLFALYGVYMAFTEGVSKALIVDCVPSHKRGAALGMLYLALGFCALSSNLLAGFLWDNFGKTIPFLVGSIVALFAILAIFLSGRLTNDDSRRGAALSLE